jgi:hypothetical protein
VRKLYKYVCVKLWLLRLAPNLWPHGLLAGAYLHGGIYAKGVAAQLCALRVGQEVQPGLLERFCQRLEQGSQMVYIFSNKKSQFG